jgi:hypothetical protein
MDRADGDAYTMQASGGDYESHAVEQATLSGRQFGAVGVSVKDGEDRDDSRGDRERRAKFKHDSNSQQNGGSGDAVFDAGERDAHETEHAAESHDHGKCNWQRPDCRRAELCSPQADSDHGEHVVES